MAVDWWLLTRVERPVLRFYRWSSPTLSLGYRQQFSPPDPLPRPLRSAPRVIRPTGGGYLLHADEITYSLAVPDGHPLARRSIDSAYGAVRDAFEAVLVDDGVLEEPRRGGDRSDPEACLSGAAAHESVQQGRKWMASAQLRRRGGMLQHGSLFWSRRGWPSHPGVTRPYFLSESEADVGRRRVRNGLIQALAESLFDGRTGELLSLSESAWNDCNRLKKQFRVDSWGQLPVFQRGD